VHVGNRIRASRVIVNECGVAEADYVLPASALRKHWHTSLPVLLVRAKQYRSNGISNVGRGALISLQWLLAARGGKKHSAGADRDYSTEH